MSGLSIWKSEALTPHLLVLVRVLCYLCDDWVAVAVAGAALFLGFGVFDVARVVERRPESQG